MKDGLFELPGKIAGKLVELFVPQEGIVGDTMSKIRSLYLINQAIQLKTKINNLWHSLGFYGTPTAPKVTFSLSTEGTKSLAQFKKDITISLDWYTPYKPYVDGILSAFMLLFYLYRLFVNLPATISGTVGSAVSLAGSAGRDAKGGNE